MAKTEIIKEWREVYPSGFTDGPNNTLKPELSRPARWSFIVMTRDVLAVRMSGGREEVRRTYGPAHECIGDTEREMLMALAAFIQQPDIRLLADTVRANEPGDVPAREPTTPELLDGTAAIYQSKEHIQTEDQ